VIGKRHAVTNKHIIDLVWQGGIDRLAEAATTTEEGLLISSEMHAPLSASKSLYIPPMKRKEQATKKQQTIVTIKFIVPNVIVPITIYNQANRGFKCEIIVYSPSPYDDYVVLRTLPGEADLCNDAPTLENARKGIEYLMMVGCIQVFILKKMKISD
jgi:hypothetical protein